MHHNIESQFEYPSFILIMEASCFIAIKLHFFHLLIFCWYGHIPFSYTMYHFFHSCTLIPVPRAFFGEIPSFLCVRVSLSFQSLWLGNACDVNKCEKRNVAQDVLTSRRAKCKSNRYIILPSKNHIFKMISGEWKCGREMCIYVKRSYNVEYATE